MGWDDKKSYQTPWVLCSTHSPLSAPAEVGSPLPPQQVSHSTSVAQTSSLLHATFYGGPAADVPPAMSVPACYSPPSSTCGHPRSPSTAARRVTSAVLRLEPPLAVTRRGVGPHGLQVPRLWAMGPHGAAGATGDHVALQEFTPCHGRVLAGRVCEQVPTRLPVSPPSFIPCASSCSTAEGSSHRPPHLPGLIHRGAWARTPMDLPQVPAQGTCIPTASIRHIPAPLAPQRVADTVLGVASARLSSAGPVFAHLSHRQRRCRGQPQAAAATPEPGSPVDCAGSSFCRSGPRNLL